jgi:hypothetical protein
LLPYNPTLILDKLPKSIERPITPPPQAVLSVRTLQIPVTPANVAQIQELVKVIAEGGMNDLAIQHLQKLEKGACKALTSAQLQSIANAKMMEVAKEGKSAKTASLVSIMDVLGL